MTLPAQEQVARGRHAMSASQQIPRPASYHPGQGRGGVMVDVAAAGEVVDHIVVQ